jgi:hypothetical protein
MFLTIERGHLLGPTVSEASKEGAPTISGFVLSCGFVPLVKRLLDT